jgi:hypothetical protein
LNRLLELNLWITQNFLRTNHDVSYPIQLLDEQISNDDIDARFHARLQGTSIGTMTANNEPVKLMKSKNNQAIELMWKGNRKIYFKNNISKIKK